jgi:hypothetical protein
MPDLSLLDFVGQAKVRMVNIRSLQQVRGLVPVRATCHMPHDTVSSCHVTCLCDVHVDPLIRPANHGSQAAESQVHKAVRWLAVMMRTRRVNTSPEPCLCHCPSWFLFLSFLLYLSPDFPHTYIHTHLHIHKQKRPSSAHSCISDVSHMYSSHSKREAVCTSCSRMQHESLNVTYVCVVQGTPDINYAWAFYGKVQIKTGTALD